MDEVKEHVCKVCGKSFPSGRSLGGHMRSHAPSAMVPPPPEAVGYGLRENPKKSSRFNTGVVEESSNECKRCKDCGKRFPSWRSLFGHMRCHSAKLRRAQLSAEEEDDDDINNDEWEEEGSSDETNPVSAAVAVRLRNIRWPRPRLRRVAAIQQSPPPSPQYENEQKDVALSLIMLSRDARMFHCPAAEDESSEKNSINLQNEDRDQRRTKRVESIVIDADSDDELEIIDHSDLDPPLKKKKKKKEGLLDSFVDELRRGDYNVKISINVQDPIKKNSNYECMTCKKIFKSYQALGGHRASHKKVPSYNAAAAAVTYSELSIETISTEPSLSNFAETAMLKRKKIAVEYECEICGRSFASGQALGGHKRSHLLAGNAAGGVAAPQILDLNLPAPADDECSNVGNIGGGIDGEWLAAGDQLR